MARHRGEEAEARRDKGKAEARCRRSSMWQHGDAVAMTLPLLWSDTTRSAFVSPIEAWTEEQEA